MTTLSSADLKSLREAAEKATPKTKYTWEEGRLGDTGQWMSLRGIPSHSAPMAVLLRIEDAKYIMAANPNTILRLLDMISALEIRVACQEQALTILMDAIGKPRTGILMHPHREGDLLDALAKATTILRGGDK